MNSLDNVFAFCMAIGDTDGLITVPPLDYEKTNNIGGFSLVDDIRNRTNSVVLQQNGVSMETPISRLDSIKFPKAPCLIKIDVEGFDLNVLAGSVDLLESSNFPPLLLEVWEAEWFTNEKINCSNFCTDSDTK